MIAVATAESTCELWCNRKHRPGANPDRQEHQNIWRSHMQLSTPVKATFYPGGPRPEHEQEGAIFFDISARGAVPAMMVLETADAIELGERLIEMAEVAKALTAERG